LATPPHLRHPDQSDLPLPNEQGLLAGPRPRWRELLSVLGIAAEFLRGFRRLHFVGSCVTVFGSARFERDHRY